MDEIATTLVNTVMGGLALFGFSQVLVWVWSKLKKYRYREVIKTYNALFPHLFSGIFAYALINSPLIKSMNEYAKENDWESVKFYLEDLILDLYVFFIQKDEDRDDLETVQLFKKLKLMKWVDRNREKLDHHTIHAFFIKHENPIVDELKEIKRGIISFQHQDSLREMASIPKPLVTFSSDFREEEE